MEVVLCAVFGLAIAGVCWTAVSAGVFRYSRFPVQSSLFQRAIAEKNKNPTMSINPLTMQLNGVLDAAVMGGTENYRKAFFTASYLEANPQNEGLVAELQRYVRMEAVCRDATDT